MIYTILLTVAATIGCMVGLIIVLAGVIHDRYFKEDDQ